MNRTLQLFAPRKISTAITGCGLNLSGLYKLAMHPLQG